jgi:hypothetical protein
MYTLNDFHDANIYGIEVHASKDVVLFLENENAMRHLIKLKNVECMKLNNFRLGNIIFEINIYHIDDSTEIKTTENLLCTLYDINKENLSEKWVKNIIGKIKNNSYILVELIESYGVYGVFLCETYSIILESENA